MKAILTVFFLAFATTVHAQITLFEQTSVCGDDDVIMIVDIDDHEGRFAGPGGQNKKITCADLRWSLLGESEGGTGQAVELDSESELEGQVDSDTSAWSHIVFIHGKGRHFYQQRSYQYPHPVETDVQHRKNALFLPGLLILGITALMILLGRILWRRFERTEIDWEKIQPLLDEPEEPRSIDRILPLIKDIRLGEWSLGECYAESKQHKLWVKNGCGHLGLGGYFDKDDRYGNFSDLEKATIWIELAERFPEKMAEYNKDD